LSAVAGKLYVADTNNHLIRTVDLAKGNEVATLEIQGLKPPTLPEPKRPSQTQHAARRSKTGHAATDRWPGLACSQVATS